MKCIRCGGDTYTISTRERSHGYVQRRKECSICDTRFATYEITDEVMQQIVALLDGRKNMITQIQKCLPRFNPADGEVEEKEGRKENT